MFPKGGVSKWKIASPLDFCRNGLGLQGFRQIGEKDACIGTRLGNELCRSELDICYFGVSGRCRLSELDPESCGLTLRAVGGNKLRCTVCSLDGFNIKAKRSLVGNICFAGLPFACAGNQHEYSKTTNHEVAAHGSEAYPMG